MRERPRPVAVGSDARMSTPTRADGVAANRRQLTIIERQLAQNPDDVRARVLGANALLSLGERDRGLDRTARAVIMDPEGFDTLYNAAYAASDRSTLRKLYATAARLAHRACSPRSSGF